MIKKLLSMLLAAMLIMTSAGCSKTPELEKETLKTVPSGFYKKFEKADFDRFNSNASENGLAGTKIWVEGSFEEVNTLDSEGMKILLAVFKDIDGHEWLLGLDVDALTPKEAYDDLVKHRVLVTGVYDGYSDIYEMPVVWLTQLYDRVTGNITSSAAFSYLAEDEAAPETEPEPTPEPTQEPEKEKTNSIRSDIKEAIDAYEAFIDEYISFMEKYEESDNSLTMLADYMSFMGKLTEYEEKMDALEKDINDAEYIYFVEVMNRCNLKLLKSME